MHSESDARNTSPGRRVAVEIEPAFDLRHLRYFLATAEELNFTRAAARLHVAQQALSAGIRDLELALDVRLFSRSTRHVALTGAGEAFVPAAQQILGDVADALDAVRQAAAGMEGRLVIGVAMAVHNAPVIREAINRFTETSPGVDVHVVGYDHGDPTAGVASSTSHVGIVLGPLTVAGLESLTILREPRHVLLPADHPLARRKQVVAQDLAGIPWLRVPIADSAWTRFWFQHPLGEPSTGPEVRSGVEWVPVVRAGRAIGYTLPTLAAEYLPSEIVMVPIADVEPGEVLLAWPADADPLVRRFVATMEATVAEFGQHAGP